MNNRLYLHSVTELLSAVVPVFLVCSLQRQSSARSSSSYLRHQFGQPARPHEELVANIVEELW